MKLQRCEVGDDYEMPGDYGDHGASCKSTDVERLEAENAALRAEGDRLTAMLGPSEHPDDIAVDGFGIAMKKKLAKKREEGRSGWQDAEPKWLAELLVGHVRKGDPVDIANFCMMLYQIGAPHGTLATAAEVHFYALIRDRKNEHGLDLCTENERLKQPQKPMSADEVTEPGWYWVRNTPGPHWRLRWILADGELIVGYQFIGPLKAPGLEDG